jgi:hypothetical protein
MVFNTTFNNISVISWLSVLLVKETRVPGENHRPAASHWQTLSHDVVSSTSRLTEIRSHNFRICIDYIGSGKSNYHLYYLTFMFRKFPVASSLNESREELDYDGTKNCILEIENDLQQLRQKLKHVKRNSKTRYGHDLGDIERHIKQDIHQHMRSLNQVSDNYWLFNMKMEQAKFFIFISISN